MPQQQQHRGGQQDSSPDMESARDKRRFYVSKIRAAKRVSEA